MRFVFVFLLLDVEADSWGGVRSGQEFLSNQNRVRCRRWVSGVFKANIFLLYLNENLLICDDL